MFDFLTSGRCCKLGLIFALTFGRWNPGTEETLRPVSTGSWVPESSRNRKFRPSSRGRPERFGEPLCRRAREQTGSPGIEISDLEKEESEGQ